MKLFKFISFIFLFFGFTSIINAQDIITQKNGEEIQVKVTEVGTSDVKYKKFGSETGPTYTLSKSEIFMIKYENGEKDVFEDTPGRETRPAAQSSSRERVQTQGRQPLQSQSSTGNAEKPQSAGITKRKAFAGIGIGGTFLLEDYSNIDAGVQVNFNFGYLFTEHVGIYTTIFGTSYSLSDYNDATIGLGGLLVGPLFSTAISENKFELDLRPVIGFAKGHASIGNISGSFDGTSFAFGIGGSARWNIADRFSLSLNLDYNNAEIDDLDFSSMGITVGGNFRF